MRSTSAKRFEAAKQSRVFGAGACDILYSKTSRSQARLWLHIEFCPAFPYNEENALWRYRLSRHGASRTRNSGASEISGLKGDRCSSCLNALAKEANYVLEKPYPVIFSYCHYYWYHSGPPAPRWPGQGADRAMSCSGAIALGGIAMRCGTSVSALRQANPGLGQYIYAGQTLWIPGSSSGYVPATASGGTYVVRWGDTLRKIERGLAIALQT